MWKCKTRCKCGKISLSAHLTDEDESEFTGVLRLLLTTYFSTYLGTNTMNNCFPILEESITIKTRWSATDSLIKMMYDKTFDGDDQ